ncbi:MAG: hypothetical protein QG599_3392 [Pseudomonadota bacterium]|nr:hypothetical protein [Pseudomonadota bacterium]
MSRASELMKLPGAVAAGVFSRKGLLNDFEGPFPEAQAESLMSLCASMTLIMEMQGRLLADLAGAPGWDTCEGWTLWGPEMSLVTVRDSTCVVSLSETSLQEVISTMRTAAGAEVSI